jgi:hypothetical protein
MEEFYSQMKLVLDIVTSTQAVSLKGFSGPAFDFEGVKKTILYSLKQRAKIYPFNSTPPPPPPWILIESITSLCA